MLSWLTGRIAAYVAGGLLLAAITASGVAWWQWSRAAGLEVERDAARADAAEALAAATAKDFTIGELRTALDQWRALVVPADTINAAARRTETAAAAVEARARALNAREEADRARPDCAALLAADLAGACPAIAGGVRERAARRDARGPDPGARAGGEAAP